MEKIDDRMSPEDLFSHGIVTPEQFLNQQPPRTRELVRSVMANHDLTLAEALTDLWHCGGL